MRVSQLLLAMGPAMLLLLPRGRCDEAAAKVEQFGNPTNWQVSGVESFDPENIKRSLSRDFDVVLAAHRQAPRANLSTVMRERLLEGYRAVGFADADATVSLDEQQGQVKLRVTEGNRYRRGGIRVIGVDDEIAEQVRRSLTTEQLPDTAVTPVIDDRGELLRWLDKDGDKVELAKALWLEGKPAAFNQSVRAAIDRRVVRTLADLGYMAAKVNHELVRNEATAVLLVRVEDIGSPAVLREIEISGNERNSREEIIEHLGLRIGQRFANREKQSALFALRESARFIEQQVDTTTMDANGGIKLAIKLTELAVAPRLSEPLSREDAALLKLHFWETQGAGRELDRIFHLDAPTAVIDGILSPTAGLMLTIRIPDAHNAANSATHVLLVSAHEAALYNLRDRRCFVLPIEKRTLDITTGIKVQGNDPEHAFKFTFNVGFSSLKADDSGPPIKMKTLLEPVYYVALARLRQPIYSWDGDLLTVETDRGTLTVDSQTGCLLNRSFTADAQGTFAFEYRAGAFDTAVQQLRQTTVGVHNEYDAAHPISSTARYGWSLLEVLAALKPEAEILQRSVEPKAVAAIEKLLDHGLLNSCDEAFVSDNATKQDDRFSIPPSESFSISFRAIGRVAASLTDIVFTRDTWPSILWRETALFLAGHREYTGTELTKIANDDSLGPIGHWLLAELLEYVDSRASQSIAQRGLRRVNRAAFERDVALLTGNWTGNLDEPIRAICSLSDEEVAAIGRILLDDTQELVRSVQILRQGVRQDGSADMQFVLGQLWSNEWQQRVSRRLNTISQDRLPRVAEDSTKTVK